MAFNFGSNTPAPGGNGGPSTPATGGFSFGASSAATPTAATPAPAGGGGGGFSFGASTTAPAPAPGAPTPAPAPGAGGFSFGSSTPATPAPAPTPAGGGGGGGFSFGSTTNAAPTPAPTPAGGGLFSSSTTAAPAASAPSGSINFGAPTGAPATAATSTATPGVAPSTTTPAGTKPSEAPTSSTTAVPAPPTLTTGPSSTFGAATSSTPASAAPSATGFSFGGGSLAASTAPGPNPAIPGLPTTTQATTIASPATANLIQVSEFDSVFPNIKISSKLKNLCDKVSSSNSQAEEAQLAGQELCYLLQVGTTAETQIIGNTLVKPLVLEWSLPDAVLRQKLQSNPVVLLPGNKEARMTQPMLEDVFALANDLRIPESQAITLYRQANSTATRSILASEDSLLDKAFPSSENDKKQESHKNRVAKTARELYFFERHCSLKTLLFLIQSRQRGPRVMLEATDSLIQNNLVSNLVALIREWTKRISQLEQELAAQKEAQTGNFINMMAATTLMTNGNQSNQNASKKPGFAKVHLLYAQLERQTAVECLFYLAYQTQLTADEVGSMIDLIRDLTNGFNSSDATSKDDGLRVLDPFRDVPHPFVAPHPLQAEPNWAATFNSASTMTNKKDKEALAWQRELVAKTWNSGKPHLLNCVSPLVLAVICALDARQELMDRNLHGSNSFGPGNKLLPPGDTSLDGLKLVHSRLGPESEKEWKRKDIWGLLAASYAVLLRSAAPAFLSSPRPGGPRPAIDVRSASQKGFGRLPGNFKSFSFARLCLVPSLQRLNDDSSGVCDNSEFFIAVLSDFVSNYLNVMMASGDMPISRNRWEKDQEEELKLRRLQQEQQRQFQAWSGTSGADEEVIPASVDIMKRPDCMDDIIALAATMCAIGPDYSHYFWSEGTTEDSKYVPSRALLELERIQAMDNSLLPCYLSFLAALACSEEGATVVHELLSRTPDAVDASTSHTLVTWSTLMSTLRWYARELSPLDYDGVSASSASSSSSNMGNSGSSSAGNTSYYYFERSSSSSRQTSGENLPSTGGGSSSSTSPSSSKPKELGDRNKAILSSHLALIMNVASHSALARCAILSINLPISATRSASNNNGAGGSDAGTQVTRDGDDTLLVLFSLAIAPLSPELRGATMTVIASLLHLKSSETKEQVQKIREMALMGWEFLESCQLLPIAMLDQYPQLAEPNGRSVVSFPPSSTTLAAGGNANAVFPPDPVYGLIYEMEHVESRQGWYPSTEGFLKLLESLVVAAGCPPKTGQAWRIRTGCSPYIEFVVDFVLPRASSGYFRSGSTRRMPQLPFRVLGDKSRLISHALSVVEAVVTRYSIPSKLLKTNPGSNASALLGINVVAEEAVRTPHEADERVFVEDYRNQSVNQFQPPEPSFDGQFGMSTTSSSASTTSGGASIPAIPSPKCPGFMILGDVLSSAGGNIFEALAETLADDEAHRGISPHYGLEADRASLTYALFGETPPTLSSAKAGAKQSPSSKPLQSFLKPILPAMGLCKIDGTAFDDAVFWREKAISLALRILCAVAVREDAFHAAVLSAKEPLKIVPILRFEKKRIQASRIRVTDVQLSRLTSLLFSSEFANKLRLSIVEYIGYSASSIQHDVNIATGALSLVFYSHQSMGPHHNLDNLCGSDSESERILSQAVANRMIASSRRPDSNADAQVIGLILNWILSDLRSGFMVSASQNSLAQVLLGVPTGTKGGNWKPGSHHPLGKPNDCFDAILELVRDVRYITGRSTSAPAACCFEILFRLYDLIKSGQQLAYRVVLYTAERLRSIEFWRKYIALLLADRVGDRLSPLQTAAMNRSSGDENLMHSIAWLLKAISYELRLLVGFASTSALGVSGDIAGFLAPRPLKCKDLMSYLFSSPFIAKTIICRLPLERSSVDSPSAVPPKEAIRAAVYGLPGPADVVDGYEQVSGDKLIRQIKSQSRDVDEAAFRKWAAEWNALVAWDCASSHISSALYMVLGSALNSSKSLLSHALWADGGAPGPSGPNDLAALQVNDIADMLILILHRLLNEGSPERHRGMDSMLFLCATRNLSSAILLLCQEIVDRLESGDAPAGADVCTVCVLLSRTLASSENSTLDSHIRHERTTVLGSALTIVVRHLAASEPNMLIQHADDLVAAADALTKLSCFKVTSTSPPGHAVVATLARSNLGMLIASCSDDAATREHSFVTRVLSQRLLKTITELVASLDEDVCKLLKSIALQRFGCGILLNAGIFGALIAAADTYMAEEARIEGQLQGHNYQKITLGAPPFLASHLQFLTVLMSSPDLSRGFSSDVSIHVLEILGKYKSVVHRLCSNYPLGADVLRLCMTCLVQAASLSQPIAARELLPGQQSDFERIFSQGGFIENGILMLSVQLWENPLPRKLLPSLPKILSRTSKTVDSKLVTISLDEQQSWWDVLDKFLEQRPSDSQFSFVPPSGSSNLGLRSTNSASDRKWNESKFEYSIVAADILSLGISLLKRSDSLDLIDGISVAVGLCRCADASLAIERRLQCINSIQSDAMDTTEDGGNRELEGEYLTLLGTKLGRCVVGMLVIALMKLRALKQKRHSHKSELITDFCKQLSMSLDHTGLESKGVGCSQYASDVKTEQEFVKHLCNQLRSEMTQ